MNERKITEFMEQLSQGKSHRSNPDSEATPSDAEMMELENLWNQQLSIPLADMKSQTECERFSERLQAYEQGLRDNPATVTGFPTWRNRWQLYVGAIAAMLLVAFGIDQFTYRANLKTQKMNGEITELKEMLAMTLIRQDAANDRIDGVVWAANLKHPEPILVDELVRMLDSDPSINVRLAALQSLASFSDSADIRKSLRDSIAKQTSSLVTLNICKVLVQHSKPEEYPALMAQLENSCLGPEYIEPFKKTLTNQI